MARSYRCQRCPNWRSIGQLNRFSIGPFMRRTQSSTGAVAHSLSDCLDASITLQGSHITLLRSQQRRHLVLCHPPDTHRRIQPPSLPPRRVIGNGANVQHAQAGSVVALEGVLANDVLVVVDSLAALLKYPVCFGAVKSLMSQMYVTGWLSWPIHSARSRRTRRPSAGIAASSYQASSPGE